MYFASDYIMLFGSLFSFVLELLDKIDHIIQVSLPSNFRRVLFTLQEYFEALEVLNHHEFAARSISPDEQGILAETADGNQEPPEEAETGDADFLSEVEGEEIDMPRIRWDHALL